VTKGLNILRLASTDGAGDRYLIFESRDFECDYGNDRDNPKTFSRLED